jgi:signal transduction histidine kinase
MPLFAGTDVTAQLKSSIARVERYISTSDTTSLTAALVNINANFHLCHDEKFLRIFSSAARKAEKKHHGYAQGFYNFMGLWHKQHNNPELAVDNFVRSYELTLSSGKKADGTWMLVELGNLFFAKGEMEQASVFYDKALSIAWKVKDHYAMSVIYMNLGMVAHQRGHLAREIELLKQSASERLLSNDPVFVCHTYVKLAGAYLELNNTDSAQRYLSEARKLYYAGGEDFGLLHEMPAMIDIEEYRYRMAIGEEKQAATALANARSYLLKTNLTPQYLETFITESDHLWKKKRYKDLSTLLQGKVGQFKVAGLTDLEQQALHYLARSWSITGNEKQASQSYERLVSLDDSLRNARSTSRLNHVRSIIDLYEKDADLRVAEQQLAHEQEKELLRARERGITRIFTITGFVAAIVLLVLLIRLQKQKKDVLKLHSELEQQNEQVKANSLKLERSNLVKDKLFSIIGHDLRGPMNSLLGITGLIREEIKREAKPDLSVHLQLMENTLKETADLFERLLQWSKLDKKQIHFNPAVIDMQSLVEKVLRFYQPSLHYKKIDVAFNHCGCDAFADINITDTILRNLIANAIQVLPYGKSIFITTEILSQGEILVRVRDNGDGFNESVLGHFAAGEEADAAASNGLGLVLCRELARMNNGTISINNHDTGGAEVRFTLPLYESEMQRTVVPVVHSSDYSDRKDIKIETAPVY